MNGQLTSLRKHIFAWRQSFRKARLTTLRQHVVLPYSTPWIGGPSQEKLPEYGRMKHGDSYVDSFPDNPTTNYKQLKGRYLYGGPFLFHFGCIMVDSVSRVWAWDAQKYNGVVFAFCPLKKMTALPPWTRNIYSYLGLDPERIVIVREPVQVERLDISEPGSTFMNGPSEWYLDFLKNRQLNTGYNPSDKLYFGRSHIKRLGTTMGESYFGKLIRDSGFKYVVPEKISLLNQLSAIQNCKQAIFSEGSALYLYELLHSTDTKCFMLPRRNDSSRLFEPYITPRAEFHRIGGDSAFLRLPDAINHDGPKSASYSMNPKEIFDDLQAQQLISSQLNFDFSEYEHFEREDALEYYGADNLRYAETQLRRVKTERQKK